MKSGPLTRSVLNLLFLFFLECELNLLFIFYDTVDICYVYKLNYFQIFETFIEWLLGGLCTGYLPVSHHVLSWSEFQMK